jgi:hypothetical protein
LAASLERALHRMDEQLFRNTSNDTCGHNSANDQSAPTIRGAEFACFTASIVCDYKKVPRSACRVEYLDLGEPREQGFELRKTRRVRCKASCFATILMTSRERARSRSS